MDNTVIKNNSNIKTEVDNVIALCHVIDKFSEFHKNILNYISQHNIDEIKLQEIVDGKKVRFNKTLKQFYQENKEVIDKINEHSAIGYFIYLNYTYPYQKDERIKNILNVYMYIYDNKNRMKRILEVLSKLKELGIESFSFDEGYNFTNKTNTLYDSLPRNYKIMYYDNIETLPGYDKDSVTYKTKGSNYEIVMCNLYGDEHLDVDSVRINSLTFNPDRLPKIISDEEIFDKIIQSKKENKDIVSSVDLGVGIEDVNYLIEKLNKTVDEINDTETKIELTKVLKSIQEDMKKLEVISGIYNSDIADKNKNITKEFLEQEKVKYKKERESSIIH